MPNGTQVTAPYQRWLSEEGLMLIKCWARDGMTTKEIAERIGVRPKTICEWRNRFPEFKEALDFSREIADYKVEAALYKRCVGFHVKEVKTLVSGSVDKNGNRATRIETIDKEVIPDVTACLAWLNNRRPAQWKRNRDNLITPEEANMKNITVNIIKGDKSVTSIKAKLEDEEAEWEAEWNAADDEDWNEDWEE